MEKAIKQKFESEYGDEQYHKYEFEFELSRPAERVFFRKVSKPDLKNILSLRIRPHPILGQV